MLARVLKSQTPTIDPALNAFLRAAGDVLLDKPEQMRLALCCLLGKGHLLIEDTPGMGKTTMVKLIAQLTGLDLKRIQFTNDLLPADILGTTIFDEKAKTFVFHPGPIFGHIILGDELNRATPRTQSAFLQAMEEGHITLDGHNYALPQPFFFIGTQNPQQSIGTFPLPESQLDRFLMRIEMGLPSRKAEQTLIAGTSRQNILTQVQAKLSLEKILELQAKTEAVHISETLTEYIMNITDAARAVFIGYSPRTSIALARASKGWAMLDGRDYVIPEDVQAVLIPVVSHRVTPRDNANQKSDCKAMIQQIIRSVPVS